MPRRDKNEKVSPLVRTDGSLALSFVNTAAKRRDQPKSYVRLVNWGRRNGALTRAEATFLKELAAERRPEAAKVFRSAERLRRVLSRIFEALADQEVPPPESIKALNGYLARVVPPRHLVQTEKWLRASWPEAKKEDLTRPLWRVVLSAFVTLKSGAGAKTTRCAAEGCGVLFLADSPGVPRKWCNMKTCGNRAKAKRYYRDKLKVYREEVQEEAEEVRRERVEAKPADQGLAPQATSCRPSGSEAEATSAAQSSQHTEDKDLPDQGPEAPS